MVLEAKILKQTGELAPRTKPWQLIRDAIHDLTLQERCKSVEIDMGVWHRANGVCCQCLAGCTISRRLSVPLDKTVFAWELQRASSRLNALDKFRCGLIHSALAELLLQIPTDLGECRNITPYEMSPENFKRDMLTLADDLEVAFAKRK